MSEAHIGIAILCFIAIVVLVVFVLCHSMDVLTYISSWIQSTKEEKLGLTRTKGHYNANGYLASKTRIVLEKIVKTFEIIMFFLPGKWSKLSKLMLINHV